MYARFTLNIIRRNRRVMVSVNRRWLDACIFPSRGTTAAENNIAEIIRGRRKTTDKVEADGGEKEREERERERETKRREKTLKRAVASPRYGIYDVISSLTVNNFPRGYAEDTMLLVCLRRASSDAANRRLSIHLSLARVTFFHLSFFIPFTSN